MEAGQYSLWQGDSYLCTVAGRQLAIKCAMDRQAEVRDWRGLTVARPLYAVGSELRALAHPARSDTFAGLQCLDA